MRAAELLPPWLCCSVEQIRTLMIQDEQGFQPATSYLLATNPGRCNPLLHLMLLRAVGERHRQQPLCALPQDELHRRRLQDGLRGGALKRLG